MGLTEKQKRFIDYYLELGNASEAARQAGYSAKIANRIATENLSKPVIKDAIDARLKELEDARIAKVNEVLQFLTSTLRREVTEPHIVVEGTGDGCSDARVIELGPSIRDRIEAGKQLLKRYPTELDEQEQRMRIAKIEQDIKDAGLDDADDVRIIDDLGAEYDAGDTT